MGKINLTCPKCFSHRLSQSKIDSMVLSKDELPIVYYKCNTCGTEFWSEGFMPYSDVLTVIGSNENFRLADIRAF